MGAFSLSSDLTATVLEAGKLRMDLSLRRVTFANCPIALTPREFSLLECLLRERGHLMTRSMLFKRIYGDVLGTSEKAIEVLMSTLRNKLAKVGACEVIETRRSHGYVIPD